MNRTTITFTEMPEWTLRAKPGALTFFEAIALADLEGKWIRLSAATQKALLGAVVFGKQELCVTGAGDVEVKRSTCFGMDCEVGYYGLRSIRAAVEQCAKLSPGFTGPGYLNMQDLPA